MCIHILLGAMLGFLTFMVHVVIHDIRLYREMKKQRHHEEDK